MYLRDAIGSPQENKPAAGARGPVRPRPPPSRRPAGAPVFIAVCILLFLIFQTAVIAYHLRLARLAVTPAPEAEEAMEESGTSEENGDPAEE